MLRANEPEERKSQWEIVGIMEDADGIIPRQIDFPEAIEVANWAGIRVDLEFVRDACDRLLVADEGDAVLRRAFFDSALVAYARCFKGHEGVRVGLDESDFDSMDEPNVVGLHQFFIDLRDRHVSHSVNEFERVIIGVAELDNQPTIVDFNQYAILGDEAITDLNVMAEFLIGVASEKSATAESIVLYRYSGLTEEQMNALPSMKATEADSRNVGLPRDGLKRHRLGRGER